MKPDGTHTIEEILEICNTELQSWERSELAGKLDPSSAYKIIKEMSVGELMDASDWAADEFLECIGEDEVASWLEEQGYTVEF